MIDCLFRFIQNNHVLRNIFLWFNQYIYITYIIAGITLLMVIASIIAVPLIVINLPSDFLLDKKRKSRLEKIHVTVRILIIIIKNLIGIILIAAGVLMLILPGQGILTIFIGLVLVDIPGKKKLVFLILSNPIVLNAINWIRKKNKRESLNLSKMEKKDS